MSHASLSNGEALRNRESIRQGKAVTGLESRLSRVSLKLREEFPYAGPTEVAPRACCSLTLPFLIFVVSARCIAGLGGRLVLHHMMIARATVIALFLIYSLLVASSNPVFRWSMAPHMSA